MSTFLLLCFVGLVQAGDYGKNSKWSYDWSANPQGNWGANYAKCKNTVNSKQSPIDIKSKDTVYKDMELKTNNYDVTDNVYFNMTNSGKSVGFLALNDNGAIPQTVEFKGTTYRLYQFHYHWGSNNYQGSEHTLDAKKYPAEVHIIHYNTKYANAGEAIAQDDGLLVWGHFLQTSSKSTSSSPLLASLLTKFDEVKDSSDAVSIQNVALDDLIPAESGDFYHYSGSLTTPPCHESVQWIVNKNPILVSEDQMDTFRTLKDKYMGANAINQDNFRKPQSLHGREVQRNFDKQYYTENEKCSFGLVTKPIVGVFLALAAIATYCVY